MFNEKTLRDINNWVKKNTDGMIEKIIDDFDPSAVMYLINTVLFDAEWENIYKKDEIGTAHLLLLTAQRERFR